MKLLHLLILIGLCLSCKDETRENPPLKGDYFIRGNPWKFYFTDQEGNSAIKLKPGAILPTTDTQQANEFQQAFVPDNYEENATPYTYNGNFNNVGFDQEKGLYYWMTGIPGNNYITDNEFYVHYNRMDTDTIRVKFRFSNEGDFADPLATITELYYNENLVIKNDNYISGDGIFIQK